MLRKIEYITSFNNIHIVLVQDGECDNTAFIARSASEYYTDYGYKIYVVN